MSAQIIIAGLKTTMLLTHCNALCIHPSLPGDEFS